MEGLAFLTPENQTPLCGWQEMVQIVPKTHVLWKLHNSPETQRKAWWKWAMQTPEHPASSPSCLQVFPPTLRPSEPSVWSSQLGSPWSVCPSRTTALSPSSLPRHLAQNRLKPELRWPELAWTDVPSGLADRSMAPLQPSSLQNLESQQGHRSVASACCHTLVLRVEHRVDRE